MTKAKENLFRQAIANRTGTARPSSEGAETSSLPEVPLAPETGTAAAVHPAPSDLMPAPVAPDSIAIPVPPAAPSVPVLQSPPAPLAVPVVPTPPIVPDSIAMSSKKLGRPATGKRSDEAWIGRTFYIQRSTDMDMDEALMRLKRQGVKLDKSELVDKLLVAWNGWHRGENLEVLLSDISPIQKAEDSGI